MAGYIFGTLAAAALTTAGVAATAGLRSADALPVLALAEGASQVGQCSVKVVRTGAPGTADIVRDQLADGSCVCVVTTGPAANNGAAEDTVTNLLRDRECSSAPAAGEAAKGAGFGPAGSILPAILGATGAGGLAAGLGTASNG